MTSNQLFNIVRHYSQKGETGNSEIKLILIPDQKTVFVEQIDGVGPAVTMDKYQVDGTTYWAGYSSRSETVYISLVA